MQVTYDIVILHAMEGTTLDFDNFVHVIVV
jgi:hypothetical protein